MEWFSDGDLAVNTADDDTSYSLVDYSNTSYDQTNNAIDWYFPVIDFCEDRQWLLFEDKKELNDSCISEICYIFKKKLSCEFQTELFLQHPLIIKKLIKWLNENKETELILECLNYLVEKLIKQHFEYTSGLCEYVENINNYGSNSQITTGTNSETTANNENSRWGIAKFCASLMPTLMKHIAFNCGEAFSLFMSSMHLLSSIAGNCNITFYLELIISNCSVNAHMLLNEPLPSLMFLIIAKELLPYCLPNEHFKEVIFNILKQPYWVHLYPDLYHQLYVKIINEELLETNIIKMVENTYTLLFSRNLDIKQYGQLLNTSMPIIWFHQKFSIIDKFIEDVCKYVNLTDPNGNEYSNILLNLLSYKSSDVIIHTYSALNKTIKSILNNFYSQSNKINRLLEHLLCTKVLNEIICFGCINSNEQICQLASEVIELLLNCKITVKINQWEKILSNLVPVLPVLYCYATQTSTFGQMIFNLFHPDQAEKLNISKLMLLHSIIIMLLSKDKKCRIEANNRLTWFLQTNLNKSIDLPNDIFVIEFDDLSEKVEEPIGGYSTNDLDDMIDLIENNSSHQTVKCALYKVSVMLEYSHLQQHFIHNRGMNIILNLLKSTKLFINERGLLIALLKLILCFIKKKKFTSNENNLLANNFEIQLQLISVLSDFYEIPLVKQYILQILFSCIFNQYLTKFNEIPSIVASKIYIPIQINKYWNSTNNCNDVSLFSKIKESKSCMDVLILTWNLKHFDNIDLFLENGLATSTQGSLFHEVFYNFRKASVKWSVKKYLIDLIAAKSHPVALSVLGDLKRYLELSVYIEQFDLDEELLENALQKFLILPPIMLSDLQTLIVVMKLLHFVLQRRVLINKFHWVPDILMKSKCMHHNMADNFKNDDISNQLCNQFFVELYEVYWLCLKNYSHFCTLDLTTFLFHQLPFMKNEFVLLQVNLKCLTLLTINQKNIDRDLLKLFLSQLIPLKTILMNRYNEKNIQRSYLTILNHILHHTILVPNICEVWCIYDWETWTWSMIHSTDPLVRALIFQFSAGLAVIDISVSYNLINLALNYFCEIHCLENCIVAEQATIFCSNVFCNPKFKNLCHKYIIKLDFNTFIHFINLCSNDDFNKFEKNKFSTSPKLVANICCMLFNMITLTGIDLQKFDQNNHFIHSLMICLKKNLTPVCIENPNIMEMCGRICSILTLFIPFSNYSFENVLTPLNIIYERIDIKLDHCTIMVWRSLFKLTTTIIQYTNYKNFILTDYLISALLKSITSVNHDLSIDALNVVVALCSLLLKQSALRICKVLIETLISDWHIKKKRTMLLIALSNVFLEHPFTYETAKQERLLYFMISKLKMMLLQVTKQSNQKSKTLLNNYLEIVGFFCNIFHGCVQARKDASSELPDVIHKFWSIVISNPKSDILVNTMQMLVSLTSNCPSACSAMTMTSSTLGVDPKTKITSYSLFHDIVSLSSNFNMHTNILSIMLLLISNCCQAQECRTIITKSKLLSNIISVLNLKDKKRSNKIEQECLNFLLIFTSYNEGQIYLLKVDYVMDILVDLLKSNFKNDSLAILRNLCFNVQNRVTFSTSDVFLNGIKSILEEGNLTNQNYKDISLSMWSIAYNNQKARLELRHWGIDKYFKKCDLSLFNDETQMIMNRTYQILKSK